ncbi:MAG: DUF2085 domain-containing protein [Methanobacteriota archaeon]
MLEYTSFLVCHQIPERTLSIGGKLLPLCARCTGIYCGFFSRNYLPDYFWKKKGRAATAFKDNCIFVFFYLSFNYRSHRRETATMGIV